MTKKSRQKFKYRENEESFYDEIKNIFIILKGFHWSKQKGFERWKSEFNVLKT